jgi:hypothetical protein
LPNARLARKVRTTKSRIRNFILAYFEIGYSEVLFFLDLGRWWYNEHEVDVVGFITDGGLSWVNANSPTLRLTTGALASLEDHAAEIRWTPKGDERTLEYSLFTRNGATQSVQEAVSERDDVQLFDLEDITEHA